MLRRIACLLVIATLSVAARDRVIIDCDSGLGDDAAAVVMLLRSPAQVDIAGITLVPGNVWPSQNAADMFRVLDRVGQPQPPVYSGAETPLVHTAGMAAEQARRWGKIEFTGAFAEKQTAPAGRQARPGAVEFLISEIEKHPGEITVLAIGPMTNIALALRLKPEIETKIKRIVFMGGNVRVPGTRRPRPNSISGSTPRQRASFCGRAFHRRSCSGWISAIRPRCANASSTNWSRCAHR